MKKVSSKGTGPKGQVSMRASGAHGAWEIAKSRAGFEAKRYHLAGKHSCYSCFGLALSL